MSKKDLHKKINSEPMSEIGFDDVFVPICSAPIGMFGVIKEVLKMWWKFSVVKEEI